jgi:hypothetical protein
MRMLGLTALLAIAVSTLAVTDAAADDVNAPVHLHSHTGEVTITDSVSGTVNVGMKFLSVEEACLVFEFSGDLLDPGDDLSIFVDGSDGGGFFNPGPVSQAVRTFCWSEIYQPATIADFLDGKAKLEFIASSGSVAIGSVTLTISGSPR